MADTNHDTKTHINTGVRAKRANRGCANLETTQIKGFAA